MTAEGVGCQACADPIKIGERVIRVQYGALGQTGHPHTKIDGASNDYFHASCAAFVAIRHQADGR